MLNSFARLTNGGLECEESGWFSFWPLFGLDYFFDNFEALFHLPYLRFFPFQFHLELLVQPLNRRQRHAVGVHHRDMLVVHTHVERGIKILSHWPEVPHTVVGDVTPRADR